MEIDGVARSQQEVHDGIRAHNDGRPDDAGVHFWRALACIGDVPDPAERRSLYSEIAGVFSQGGFHDLALMAVEDALAIADRPADRIAYANTHLRLGNRDEAEAAYRSILERCRAQGDFANAASAATNLATILADDGYHADAAGLLEESLGYLERVDFPDTEMNTRLALVQVLELAGRPPERILEVARVLVDRYLGHLPPPFVKLLAKIVDGAADRYAAAHPGEGAAGLKARDFARLYAVRP
jgi:tetratricopeptide (TPR) repeat protein